MKIQALLLSICYAANLGGSGTLIGTGVTKELKKELKMFDNTDFI